MHRPRLFPTFSSNKRWWRLRAFSFHGRRTHEPYVALPPKGRLLQLTTPLGIVLRELGHFFIYVHSLPWLLFCLFSFIFSYVLLYNSLMILVCFLMYAWDRYLFIWCTQTPTPFCTHGELKRGLYPGPWEHKEWRWICGRARSPTCLITMNPHLEFFSLITYCC